MSWNVLVKRVVNLNVCSPRLHEIKRQNMKQFSVLLTSALGSTMFLKFLDDSLEACSMQYNMNDVYIYNVNLNIQIYIYSIDTILYFCMCCTQFLQNQDAGCRIRISVLTY